MVSRLVSPGLLLFPVWLGVLFGPLAKATFPVLRIIPLSMPIPAPIPPLKVPPATFAPVIDFLLYLTLFSFYSQVVYFSETAIFIIHNI